VAAIARDPRLGTVRPRHSVSDPIAAADAARRILTEVSRQPSLRIPLDDALGSVLAEDVVSPLDIPAHANSGMDGYAARAEDVRGAAPERPVRLTVIEHIPAGRFPTRRIGSGQCARVFTGTPVPQGADTVIRQEDTDGGAAVVTITDDRDAGANIRAAGEDIRRGSTVLHEGAQLEAAQLGVLASLAVAHPLVYRRPRVAILTSGDEIADVDQPEEILSGRKVGSSNTHTLLAQVRRAGGEPDSLGIASDTPESLREHLGRALDWDLLITSGGISVGEHDFIRTVMAELGAQQRFWRLRMRPGAPVGFGLIGTTPWIGLPGNPVSTMVTFELFARSAIRKMAGHTLPFRTTVPVRLAEPVNVKPRLQHFLRAIITAGPEGLEARLTGPQGSGILSSMVLANALLVIPEGQFETPAGAVVQALRLDEPMHQAEPGF
jgi:molybdopterin molybdotransferase